MTLWSFADDHYVAFFWLAVVAMLVVRSVCVAFARALGAWGTKHCGTCSCLQETDDGDDDERVNDPAKKPTSPGA